MEKYAKMYLNSPSCTRQDCDQIISAKHHIIDELQRLKGYDDLKESMTDFVSGFNAAFNINK